MEDDEVEVTQKCLESGEEWVSELNIDLKSDPEFKTKKFYPNKKKETERKTCDPNKKKDTERKTCAAQAVVVVLTMLSVALLIALLVCAVRWRDARNVAMSRREQTACVNSSQLMTVCPDGLHLQGSICCGDVSYVVDALLKQYSKAKFQDTVSARMLSERCKYQEPVKKLVAMIPGLALNRVQQQGEGTMVFWNETSPEAILQGFTYKDGSIFINKTGHYYVYSQIKVTKTPNMHLQSTNTADVHVMTGNNSGYKHPEYTTTTEHPFFSHNLYRHSKTTDLYSRQLLLESSRSDCSVSSQDNTVTSSFGAVFSLVAGDTVHVETSHPQHLVDSPHSNFFGLYSV